MTRNVHVAFFILALMLCGCGKDSLRANGVIKLRVKSHATKGAAVVTSTVEASGFIMDGYTDADYHDKDGVNVTEHHYINGAQATYSAGTWSLSGDARWINGVNIRFWSYPQETLDAITDINQQEGTDQLSFKYSDFDAQTDLIMAYNAQSVSYRADGGIASGSETLDITFYHALSQIRFAVCPKTGKIDAGTGFAVDDFELVDVTIGGLPESGSCTFTGSDGADGFAWNPLGNSKNYTQATNTGFVSLPSGWKKENGSGEKAGNTYYVNSDVLFVIPHTTYSAAFVQVTLKRKADNNQFTRKVNLPNEVWRAGRYYTYNLQASSALNQDIAFDVEVLDWLSGGTIALN